MIESALEFLDDIFMFLDILKALDVLLFLLLIDLQLSLDLNLLLTQLRVNLTITILITILQVIDSDLQVLYLISQFLGLVLKQIILIL